MPGLQRCDASAQEACLTLKELLDHARIPPTASAFTPSSKAATVSKLPQQRQGYDCAIKLLQQKAPAKALARAVCVSNNALFHRHVEDIWPIEARVKLMPVTFSCACLAVGKRMPLSEPCSSVTAS